MEKLKAFVDKHRDLILDAFSYFWKNPETGYREYKTSAYLEKEFEKLGYVLTRAGNIPGFYTDVDTGRPGPTIAVMGELDGLICPTHPEADPETGAVHCCGHGAQIAALLGIAAALKEPGALEELSGKIRLMAVPAEELIETEFRKQLKEQGIIHYYGGKVEFLYRGYFDDVDIAFMIHTAIRSAEKSGYIPGGSNGCIVKEMEFQGTAAHAGSSPHLGVNALYAANLTMNAINALRETFRDDDHIRVHPIITAGGSSVNAIADKVVMESYVRGATMDAMIHVNRKVNRAAASCAAAMGANVVIRDVPGYHPRRTCQGLIPVMRQAMEQVLDKVVCEPEKIGSGCSDVGDLSSLMPVIHPYVSGASGRSHGSDYYITDPETACVSSAKVQLVFLKLLLENGAQKAKEVIAEFKPVYANKEEYFRLMNELSIDRQAVTYEEDGKVTLQFTR